MVRVLHIYPQLNNAGTEMVIMNLYNNIEHSRVQFDFCVQLKGELDDKIQSMGGIIHYIPQGKNYYQRLKNFFKEHSEYQIIHTHTHKEMGVVLKAAAKIGVQVRIAHSHNSRGDLPNIVKLYKVITSRDIEKYSTHLLACSDEAAKWLFPLRYKECVIWKNAIDLKRFQYDELARRKIRKKYNIKENDFVVCHVGRFAKQKNHIRLIGIINNLLKNDEKYHCFLVGTGPLLEEMKVFAENERIYFLGNCDNVPEILSASDVFLFPSLWEGLGIVAIEAQASGITCLASERVPKSADLGTGLFKTISLSDNDQIWEKEIKQCLEVKDELTRKILSCNASDSDYNIRRVARMAQQFYMKDFN